MSSEFVEKPKGVLVSMEEDSFSGYLYNVWFLYARNFVKLVKEGNFLAVKNFASGNSTPIYSILEIVSAVPQHYALGSSAKDTERAFPGFVLEAAKSLKTDWEQEEPLEQTTVIKAKAIPTGLQVKFVDGIAKEPEIDGSLPMIGEETHLLTDTFTSKIVNQGLIDNAIATITPGNLAQSPAVPVHISVDDLLRTHFGIFGFTNAGKSNLVSTILYNLLKQDSPLKVFLIDIMSEYPALLIDLLDFMEDAYIIVFDEESLPGGDATAQYLRGDANQENSAINAIIRTMLLPKELASLRSQYVDKIKNILRAHKIRVYEPGDSITSSILREELLQSIMSGNLGHAKNSINQWIDTNFPENLNAAITQEQLNSMISELRRYINNKRIPISFNQEQPEISGQLQQFGLGSPVPQSARTVDLSQTGILALENAIHILGKYIRRTQDNRPANMLISFGDIVQKSNSAENSTLMIFQSNRDDSLRETSSLIINGVFNIRRRRGITDPITLSVYDEADEFMPQNAKDSYEDSSRTIRNLARRGRKFGMGLSIATQRVAYLDTSTLAQPHTYFVSKMPRKYDRDTMADMFGITEDMMTKTLKFTKGQWLLVSYDATGLVNVPLPITFPNANKRIKEYLSRS